MRLIVELPQTERAVYKAIRDVLLVAKSMLMHIIGIIVVIGSHDQQSQF